MGETSKQVRVNNWGVFFLQKLQSFFNKTDYCDLTLQFEGNVQLKVHRLVVNACTEYFQILEQTCGTIGDVLVMPPDLQSDVVVPIVNFMYTGMLEFNVRMVDKLLRTAELMNIPVLTKLLQAQKQQSQAKASSYGVSAGKRVTTKPSVSSQNLPATLPGRKVPVWKRRVAPSSPSVVARAIPMLPDPLAIYDNTPKPTRFEWPDEELSTFGMLDSSFDDISYTSKPLLTQEDELRSAGAAFDELRQSTSISKPKGYSSCSIDLDEVKDYVKEQKIRSNITSELDDGDDLPEGDLVLEATSKRKSDSGGSTGSKRVRFSVNEKENEKARINVTTAGGKGTSGMNHTKIISELFKKYPHLVKKNKNIRLKIMAKDGTGGGEGTATKATLQMNKIKSRATIASNTKQDKSKLTTLDEGPWTCAICSTDDEPVEFVLYYLYRKHMTDVHGEKFDALACKYCGRQMARADLLAYHAFTRHGVKPPAGREFPKCDKCHYVGMSAQQLARHRAGHARNEYRCGECGMAFVSEVKLRGHRAAAGHAGKGGRNFNCQYCSKRYHSGINLFAHIKHQHHSLAKRDGFLSLDEHDEDDVEEETTYVLTTDDQQEEDEELENGQKDESPTTKEKIKILSDVKVTKADVQPSTEAEALNNVASGIATSLGLVDIVVLNENQQYILQNNQIVAQQPQQGNEPEFILPELTSSEGYQEQNRVEHGSILTQLNTTDIASTDELVMVLTDHDYGDGNSELINNDNSNIVVLYSHPVDGQENQQYITATTQNNHLMVNSETGVIEIRNGSGLGGAEQLTVVASEEDGQIESIEMIQRELNAHGEPKKTEESEGIGQEAMEVEEETGPAVAAGEAETSAGDEAGPMVVGGVEDEKAEPIKEEEEEHAEGEVGGANEPQEEQQQQQQNETTEAYEQEATQEEESMEVAQTTETEEGTDERNESVDSQEACEKAELEAEVEAETNHSHDENSQVSLVSHEGEEAVDGAVSEQGEEPERGEGEAKMAILDDWEDTDSQQSQQKGGDVSGEGEVSDAVVGGTSVNKLIDDWGEEEDEEGKRRE